MPALGPRAGDQAFMGTPSLALATNNTFYRFPAYPGTQINNPGFNITFPRADNYYAVQQVTSRWWQRDPNGTVVEVNQTSWTAPPEHYRQLNKWPAVWEFQEDFVDETFKDAPTPDGLLANPLLELLRYDPASGLTGLFGGQVFWPQAAKCLDADRSYPHRPNNHSCVLTMEVLPPDHPTGLPPGDNYFVALVNPHLVGTRPHLVNYISVSELFSVKNTYLHPRPQAPELGEERRLASRHPFGGGAVPADAGAQHGARVGVVKCQDRQELWTARRSLVVADCCDL